MEVNKIYQGDCLEVMRTFPETSIDTIITDPPYGLGFMGKEWDTFKRDQFGRKGAEGENDLKVKKNFDILPRYNKGIEASYGLQEFTYLWATEALRVAKPGAIMLCFGGTRTFHRIACAIEDAGWEIRDTVMWVYGSGFPKSLNIGKAVDKHGGVLVGWFGKWLRNWRTENNITQKQVSILFPSKTGGLTGCVANWELGLNIPTNEQFNLICKTFNLPFENLEEAEREVVGKGTSLALPISQELTGWGEKKEFNITKGTSEWEGWGTALKPAYEPIILAMKPLDGTFANNALKHGVAGLNIDGSRVGTDEKLGRPQGTMPQPMDWGNKSTDETFTTEGSPLGRFPANLCWSCDCDNNYLTGNALFDILSNISNQIKLCQLNNSNSNALNAEQKKHQQDTTNEEKKLCFAVENVDTLILEKILGKTLEVIFSVDTECSVEMLEESMNTSLSISLSGNEKMEEYQKVLKFITLTATNLITELKTCNLSQSQIIGSFITKVISGIREQSRVKSHNQDCWVRECFPEVKGKKPFKKLSSFNFDVGGEHKKQKYESQAGLGETGNASRFFYCAKASKAERNMGCEGLEEKQTKGGGGFTSPQNEDGDYIVSGDKGTAGKYGSIKAKASNNHPTVKPIALMEYLCTLTKTPTGGIILDPFLGSGTTAIAARNMGRSWIGIELNGDYIKIAERRLSQKHLGI